VSKILSATCNAAGQVTADDVVVTAAEVLSEGTKASTGVLLLEGDSTPKYLTSNAADLKKAIEDLSAIIAKIIEIVANHDTVTVSPGSAAANIALLTALKTTFEATKETLK